MCVLFCVDNLQCISLAFVISVYDALELSSCILENVLQRWYNYQFVNLYSEIITVNSLNRIVRY
jgi:hypothetical protein